MKRLSERQKRYVYYNKYGKIILQHTKKYFLSKVYFVKVYNQFYEQYVMNCKYIYHIFKNCLVYKIAYQFHQIVEQIMVLCTVFNVFRYILY